MASARSFFFSVEAIFILYTLRLLYYLTGGMVEAGGYKD